MKRSERDEARDAEILKRWCSATGITEEDWIKRFRLRRAAPLFRFKVGLRRERPRRNLDGVSR
jgi:hypothetical protein